MLSATEQINLSTSTSSQTITYIMKGEASEKVEAHLSTGTTASLITFDVGEADTGTIKYNNSGTYVEVGSISYDGDKTFTVTRTATGVPQISFEYLEYRPYMHGFLHDKSRVETYAKTEIDELLANNSNITISASEPSSSAGADGDVWLVYEA